MSRFNLKRKGALLSASLTLAAGAVGGYLWLNRASPEETARAYLTAWERGDDKALSHLVASPHADFTKEQHAILEGLHITSRRFELIGAERRANEADAKFRAKMEIEGLGVWTYEGTLTLSKQDRSWFVQWNPNAIHPKLDPGERLVRRRIWPVRAPILSHDGSELVGLKEAVTVGIEPRRVKDRTELKAAVEQHIGLNPDVVDRELDRPGVKPDWFLPIVEMRREAYESVKAAINPVPGLVFRSKKSRFPVSEGFGQHALGRTADATQEHLQQLGAPYSRGDAVGVSGLERVFERQLAGQPSGEIVVAGGDSNMIEVLHRFEGKSSEPLRTTLDIPVQSAAELALQGVAVPAAIVAIDVESFEIRAIASRPLSEPFNRALAGRYAPGSTFKIVTAAAALSIGKDPNGRVDCPAETAAGGKRFRNFEGKALGEITFRQAFVESCNTAFVAIADELESGAIGQSAKTFGFEERYELPLRVSGGRFPPPRDPTETAAAAIGQGRVEASPLHMATVAATAASGRWKSPRLVLSGEAQAATPPLGSEVAATLRSFMRDVVKYGTGVKATVPGEPVFGKTGTAEFGSEEPPSTHAWFVGYRGNLAFAVILEGGGVGGEVAAPVAARFLTSLS